MRNCFLDSPLGGLLVVVAGPDREVVCENSVQPIFRNDLGYGVNVKEEEHINTGDNTG